MEETIETASSCLPFSCLPHNFELQLLYLTTIFLLSPCLLFTYSTVQYMNKLNAESSLDTREGEHQSEMGFQDSQQQSKLLGPISLKVLLKKQVMEVAYAMVWVLFLIRGIVFASILKQKMWVYNLGFRIEHEWWKFLNRRNAYTF